MENVWMYGFLILLSVSSVVIAWLWYGYYKSAQSAKSYTLNGIKLFLSEIMEACKLAESHELLFVEFKVLYAEVDKLIYGFLQTPMGYALMIEQLAWHKARFNQLYALIHFPRVDVDDVDLSRMIEVAVYELELIVTKYVGNEKDKLSFKQFAVVSSVRQFVHERNVGIDRHRKASVAQKRMDLVTAKIFQLRLLNVNVY